MGDTKALNILPNFSIIANKKDSNYYEAGPKGIAGRLLTHCEKVSEGEQADIFKLSPETLWYGMNVEEDIDFIQFLKDNSESIPDGVLTDLIKYSSKFGKVTLIGDDCIQIKESDLLKEVLNNTSIKNVIYNQEENLLFFHNISFVELNYLFQKEIGCPIKIHRSKIKTFYVKLGEDLAYMIKAISPQDAFKRLYGKHDSLNEESLRKKLKLKRDLTDEDIVKFMDLMYQEGKPFINKVHEQTICYPIRFIF